MRVMVMASLGCNLAIAALSAFAWLQLAMGWGTDEERLAARGIATLKYFTVLSNLLSGATSLACACFLLLGGMLPGWLLVARLVAASAVMLTFVTVVVLLGPAFGWESMYTGGNLWMHLVLPLLAAADCCLLAPVGALPLRATAWAMLPTALYAAWYLWMVRAYADEDNPVLYDFYGFLRWGEDRVGVVLVAMLLATWLLAVVLWLASRALCLA